LAQIAQNAAIGWSEPRPWDIRVALANQQAAAAIGVDFAYRESSPRFLIALDGAFVCKTSSPCASYSGGGPDPNPTTTTVPVKVPTTTMVLTVDPSTLTRDPYLSLLSHDIDMTSLGAVYRLDGYLSG